MSDSTTTQRDARPRTASDTAVAVAAGAALGTAVVIGYAVLVHGGANASEATGTQRPAQSAPQQAPSQGPGTSDGSSDDSGIDPLQGFDPGQAQGGQVQGGLGGGAPTTSGGS